MSLLAQPGHKDADLESLPYQVKIEKATSQMQRVKEACSYYLLPSIWGAVRNKPIRRTAYLDGLRGFAALLVYLLHNQIWGHSDQRGAERLENAFGYDNTYFFVAIPGIRLLFSGGHFAVVLFFAISGYVLSMTPLSLIQSREYAKLSDNVGSALFRRWLRLFIPVIATTFIWMTCWHLFGIHSHNKLSDLPERTYFDEVWKWYCDFKNYSFVFNEVFLNKYNDHMWSIAVEFRGSIIVYTVVMAVSRCRTNVRLAIEVLLAWYFLYIVNGWYCTLFMIGVFLSDVDMLAERGELPRILERARNASVWVYVGVLAMGLYLGGVPCITEDPQHLRDSPGWYLLSFTKPQAVYDIRYFFLVLSGLFSMIAIPRIPPVKALFETHFCQYLGRVSFGLYLVHGPILWSVADRVYAAVGRGGFGHATNIPGWVDLFVLPSWGPFGMEVNFLMAQLFLLPFTLYIAEVVTKMIDDPTLKFSKWLFTSSIESKPQGQKEGRH